MNIPVKALQIKVIKIFDKNGKKKIINNNKINVYFLK